MRCFETGMQALEKIREMNGDVSPVEPQYKEFRSRFGHDSEQNLITLCSDCHLTLHAGHL